MDFWKNGTVKLMGHLVKIVAILIFILVFIVVAYFITINITKGIFTSVVQQVTKSITGKETDVSKVSPGDLKVLVGSRTSKWVDVKQVTWAGHKFEIGKLSTEQYETSGNDSIQFTDSGWYAPSFSMPRSKLLDVNLNEKVKLKITADFEGQLKNMDTVNKDCGENINWYGAKCKTTEAYHFSEFAIYIIDEDGDRQGIRVLGTRQNIEQGNTREKYKFSEFTIENTGEEIKFTDSTGFKFSYSKDLKYITTEAGTEENKGGVYGTVNLDQKWILGINCHVNGEGDCRLGVKEIQIVK